MKTRSILTKTIRAVEFTLILTPVFAQGPTTAEIRSGFGQFWKEELVYLKKAASEKDNNQAAADINELKNSILPKLDKQLQIMERWKNVHTSAEVDAEKKWADCNPLQREVSNQQTTVMMASA